MKLGERRKLKDRIGILEVRVSLVAGKDRFASETGVGKIKSSLSAGSGKVIT